VADRVGRQPVLLTAFGGIHFMNRIHFLFRILPASLLLLFFGPRDAEPADDEGFTMSSGALLGGANGTQGA